MNQMSLNRRNVSSKEARELLADPKWSKDEDSSKLLVGTVYIHADGRVLTVFSDKRGVLYPTQEAFAVLLEFFKQARSQKPHHFLKDRLPAGEDFPKQVPHLVDDLAALLKIPREDLDNSMESLSIVDKKVKRLGRVKCVEPPIFPALIAYIGEVTRQAVNGMWQMLLSQQDGETWEPWIIDPEGRLCDLFRYLYEMLAEPSEPISIQGAATIAINTRRIPSPRWTFSENPKAAVRSAIIKRAQDNE